MSKFVALLAADEGAGRRRTNHWMRARVMTEMATHARRMPTDMPTIIDTRKEGNVIVRIPSRELVDSDRRRTSVACPEYNCSESFGEIVEGHRISITVDGWKNLDREDRNREVRCEGESAGGDCNQGLIKLTDNPEKHEEGDEAGG